ncbi:MAG TPA: glycosyltransferase family 4 protein [Tepidisphaeraceae bacterium]|nr:glycosyltransferase family 4 protein [Tepidisphaeraceae bacterium]
MSIVAMPDSTPAARQRSLDEWVHIPTPGDHYSPKTGSATITVIREMTRCHASAGGRSRVLVAKGTWDGFDDGARVEIPFARLGTPPRLLKALDRLFGAIGAGRPLSGTPYAAAGEYLSEKFDGAIFVHNEPSAVEALARRCPNAKICLWAHNELFQTYTARQVKRVLDLCHRVICCSNFIARGIVQRVGESAKIVTVLNGVSTERFNPPDRSKPNNPPVILFIGRMVPEKGPDLLVKAAPLLKRQGVQFRLRMVGSKNFSAADSLTPFETALRRLALPLQDIVEFRPFQPRQTIPAEFHSADLLCVPSNWDDPCPLTVLEGRASGLPIVASRRGGIPEAAGDSAIYFDPPDVAMLAESLTECLRTISETRRTPWRRPTELDWQSRYSSLASLL